MTFPVLSANGPSGYNLTRSLRFRQSASAYLNRTLTTPTDTKKFTWSGWVKRGIVGSAYNLFFNGTPNAYTDFATFGFSNASAGAVDSLTFDQYVQGSGYIARVTTSAVYRDPSAWYHIVLVWDSANATAANRVLIYVNGSQVTSFSTATYPAQNTSSQINLSSSVNYLSNYAGTYFDGYLAEVNFVDGQALTPSSFGSTNATTGVWQPAKYTGTYGTNGFYLPFSLASTSSYGGVFNGSAQNLTTSTNASLALGTSNFTIEYWANITTALGGNTLVTSGNGTTTYDGLFGHQTGASSLILYLSSTGSSWDIANGESIGSYGATGKWNHFAITRSGSNFYTFVNGILTATFTSSASIYQSANAFTIGRGQAGSSLTGIVSNLRVVVGTALYTSAFTPSTTPLTAVTNTKLLTLQDSTFIDNSTNALTITNTGSVTSSVQYPFVGSVFNDASGNNNGWTGNNISLTTGVTYDSMTDVPTLTSATAANFAVLNPIGGSTGTNITVTNGNLTATTPIASVSNFFKIPSSISVSSGKWYFEDTVTALDANNWALSISGTAPLNDSSNQNGLSSGEVTYVAKNNSSVEQIFDNGSSTYTGGSGASAGDVIGVAFDVTNLTVQFYRNNTAVSTAQAITSATFFYISAIVRNNTTASIHNINFGQRPFTYTPPSGFVALNTYNLPASSIPNGAAYMAATTYTGTGASNVITNTVGSASFQPDFVWGKSRSAATNNALYDSVRGAGFVLTSNNTDAETAVGTTVGLSSFNSNGFTMGTGSTLNDSGQTYVGWQWKGGGTAVSNTNGSITSSVSANTTSGFSVATYTGNGTGGATIGHGLGVAPSMVVVKQRTSASATSWYVYHASLTAAYAIYWNLTLGRDGTSLVFWNNVAPTSSVFSIGTSAGVNASSGTYVAYCFAAIKGFSAFGSYTGNGSTDGPFVYLGFRPRYLMLKVSGTDGYDWLVYDSSRDPYNVTQNNLRTDTNDAESAQSANYLDFLSNGFKIRGSSAGSINPSQTVIYAAFAENPFQNALAR